MNFFSGRKNEWLLHFAWSFILFLLVKFLFGNYYEVYEAIPATSLTGLLMDGHPANIIYPIASILLSDFYVMLYRLAPPVAWYDYFMAAYLISAAAVVFSAVHTALRGRMRFPFILLLNTILFLLFFAPQILHWNYTRTSLMVCSAAFVWLTLVWLRNKDGHLRLPALFFNALLFTIGVLIRPESGQLVFLLSSVFIFFYGGITRRTVLAISSFLIPVLLIAGGIYYDRHASHDFYMQLEPVTEYQIFLGNIAGIDEMKTPEDSMKYIALKEGLTNDPAYISYDFVKRLTANHPAVKINQQMFLRAENIFGENTAHFWHLLLLNGLLFAAGIYFLVRKKGILLRYILFHLAFWLLVFLICYFMIMESRILSPLMFFYTAANVIFLFHHSVFVFLSGRKAKCIITAAVLIALGTTLFSMRNGGHAYEKHLEENHKRFEMLKQAAAGKFLVPDATGCMVLFFNNFRPFHLPDFSAFKKIYLMDFEAITLTPPYRAYLDKNCQCNSTDLAAFYDYLYLHKDEVVIAGTAPRMQLFESYLRIVRHRTYTFQQSWNILSGDTMEKEFRGFGTFSLR
jgi:hypothetical protein